MKKEIKCPCCGGTGRQERYEANQDGFEIPSGYENCITCYGEGKVWVITCPTCNGNKDIEKYFIDRITNTVKSFKRICPTCRGRGEIYK